MNNTDITLFDILRIRILTESSMNSKCYEAVGPGPLFDRIHDYLWLQNLKDRHSFIFGAVRNDQLAEE